MLLHALVLLPDVLRNPIRAGHSEHGAPGRRVAAGSRRNGNACAAARTRTAHRCACGETPSRASNLVLLLALVLLADVLLAPVALVAPVLPLELALTTEVLLVPIARMEAERREERRNGRRGWRGEGAETTHPGGAQTNARPRGRRKMLWAEEGGGGS